MTAPACQTSQLACELQQTRAPPPHRFLVCRFTFLDYECTDTAASVNPSDTPFAVVTCPAGCSAGSVVGTDVYHASSSLCGAALHAGVLTSAGGSFTVFFVAGDRDYTGVHAGAVCLHLIALRRGTVCNIPPLPQTWLPCSLHPQRHHNNRSAGQRLGCRCFLPVLPAGQLHWQSARVQAQAHHTSDAA